MQHLCICLSCLNASGLGVCGEVLFTLVNLCLILYVSSLALLLHQRARMERLMKELKLERQKLEQLKAEVNEMEFDALQRRFRRVNSTSLIPRVRERDKKQAFRACECIFLKRC